MAKGGVYLPMPEHIGLFCSSSSFVQCHQYVIGCEVIRDVVEQYRCDGNDNRRKFARVREEVPINITVNQGQSDQAVLSAVTVDMSLDGIRLQTTEDLAMDSKVLFAFDNEFSVPNWRGLAKVRWTRKVEGKSYYESGVTITDAESYHAIGQHIGVPGFPTAA